MADYSTRDQGQWVGCLHNWNLFKPREREKLNYVSIDHDWLNVWERSSSVAMLESKRSGRKLEINHGSMLAGWGKPWITSDKLWITVTDHLLVTSINEGVSVNPKSWAQLWFAWWENPQQTASCLSRVPSKVRKKHWDRFHLSCGDLIPTSFSVDTQLLICPDGTFVNMSPFSLIQARHYFVNGDWQSYSSGLAGH